jgi:hypothetical protein
MFGLRALALWPVAFDEIDHLGQQKALIVAI